MREVKVFVLGLPGSGKSTAARHIERIARDYRWNTTRISDYEILNDMFKADRECIQFSPTNYYNGFDVHDHKVFDTALEKLEVKVWLRERPSATMNELVIIEFARDDYNRSLELFSKEFLEDSYFLFINADITTCIQRIRERVAHPTFEDDHFVSEYIFEAYYHKDNRHYTCLKLGTNGDNFDGRIYVIDNPSTRSNQDFHILVEQFATLIVKPGEPDPKKETRASERYTEEDGSISHAQETENTRSIV